MASRLGFMTGSMQLDGCGPTALAQLAAKSRVAQAGIVVVALLAVGRWMTKRREKEDSTWDWSREIVVVTGGSGGIGGSIIEKLAEKGVKAIINLDLVEPGPEAKTRANVFYYPVNLTDSAAISGVVELIRAEHGDPTVLVNNAGVSNGISLLDLPEEKLRWLLDVNLIAPILLAKHFLPSMVKNNHGHVVNISSLAAFVAQARNVDYAVSKVGLLAVHEGLQQELKHLYGATGVKTTVVHPFWVRTPLISHVLATGRFKDAVLSADELAAAVVRQLYSAQGGQIIMPARLGYASIVRGLPVWIQERIRDRASVRILKALPAKDSEKGGVH